jgi:hypothetical protein
MKCARSAGDNFFNLIFETAAILLTSHTDADSNRHRGQVKEAVFQLPNLHIFRLLKESFQFRIKDNTALLVGVLGRQIAMVERVKPIFVVDTDH